MEEEENEEAEEEKEEDEGKVRFNDEMFSIYMMFIYLHYLISS